MASHYTGKKNHRLALAAASLGDFDYARCARLAGIGKLAWIPCTLLACGAATADAAMLALLVPLGTAVGGGAGMDRLWRLPWVARVLPQPPDATAAFLWLAGLMFALALVKNVFAHAQHMAMGRIRTGAARRLANLTFERYLGFGKAWFDRTSPGHTATVLDYRNDVAAVFVALLRITSSVLQLAGYLGVMLLISWRLTLIAAVLFPVVNYAARFLLDRTTAAANKARHASAQIGKHVHEVLSAMPLYQAAGQEKSASATFAGWTGRLRESAMRSWRLQGISGRIQELAGLAALLAMLALALHNGPEQKVRPALLLVFFFIARLSLPVLATIPEAILDIAERLPRCRELMAVFADDDKFQVNGGVRELCELREDIRLERLTFAYPDGPAVLREVSFRIGKGQMTALVGPSGSGKSTVANLLMRFYDLPAGTVWIDGVDIREYSIGSLRRRFSIVSQDTMLLSGTLRSNLLFGLDREAGPDELQEVIGEARLKDVMSMLPEGLDGVVGEHGVRLSGGQRQRVAIARALLRRPALLLLDEATSALDAITEELVREAIANAIRHSTALVIAHRFATIQHADHVVVMNEGRVSQQGSLTELLAVDGLFRQMSDRQQFG